MTFPFPSPRATLRSPLSVGDAVAALRAVVGPRRTLTFKDAFLGIGSEFQYVGVVSDGAFAIQRQIPGRTSMLPCLSATIVGAPQGCVIAVTMHLHWTGRLFMVLWLGILALSARVAPAGNELKLLLMLAFGLVVLHFGSWLEFKKGKAFLTATLRAEIENPAK